MRARFLSLALLIACGGDPAAPPASGAGGASAGGAGGQGAAATGGEGGVAGGGGSDPCAPALAPFDAAPASLSETGLYADIVNRTVRDDVLAFTPQFELWSDGAAKGRWVHLPPCTTIDTSDPDDWQLPVGARLWKEFRVGGAAIETRLIARTGPGEHDFVFASYLWDGDDATHVPDGVVDASGTTHDVPNEEACRRCHGWFTKGGGRPSRALGLSAVQLAHDGQGLTLSSMQALLSDPVVDPTLPADGVARAALGVLHANCGHCHNATPYAVPQVDLDLWLGRDVATAADSAAFLTAVGQPNTIFADPGAAARIVAGDAASSAVWLRMGARGDNGQMPPVGSEVVDTMGREAVRAWIDAL